MNITLTSALFLVTSSTLFGQLPAVSSLVNAANFGQQLSPGSIASVFGTNFAAEAAAPDSTPLPTVLAGVRVEVCAPGSQLQCSYAPLLYVSPSQINFVIPADNTGAATAKVISPNGISGQYPLYLRNGSPGIFHLGWDCAFPAVCPMAPVKTGSTNVQRGSVVDETGTVASSIHPLQKGKYYSLYVTGLGLNSSTVSITLAGTAPNATSIAIVPSYIGPSTCMGLQQVNFTLPDNISTVIQPAGYTPSCSSTNSVSTELRLTVSAGASPDQVDSVSLPLYLRAGDIVCRQ